MQGARVLVTGGAGFIGSALVRLLANQNAQIIVVDNLVNGKRENLCEIPRERYRLEVADIRDTQTLSRLLTGIDTIYHLACLGVRHSIHSPLENHAVNADATLRLLILAREKGVPRFVHVSTSEVYGMARSVPMDEDHPTLTKTVYGASKLAGESYARAFYETYGYSTTVVRPFNAFGPGCHHEGDSGEVIPKFVLRCLTGRPLVIFGDGTQTRDFTFVDDTARGILLAGTATAAVGQVLNLGSGREIAIRDLAHEVAAVIGRPMTIENAPPRPGDVQRLCAASGKAEVIGFSPRVSLREGLSRLRDWYLNSETPLERLLDEEVVQNWQAQRGG